MDKHFKFFYERVVLEKITLFIDPCKQGNENGPNQKR